MTQAKILFLNINLNKKLTGIERASLLRAKLFHKHLGITPTIITARYSSHYRRICESHVESGVLHEEIPDINMYEYFQGTDTVLKKKVFVAHSDWIYKPVKGTKDSRVYFNGKFIQYIKRFPDGDIDYINYFSNGKKVRRHHFDSNGYVSLVQHLNRDTQRIEVETFYHVNGKPCIIKHYAYDGKVNRLDSISLLNDTGEVIEYFENENDFIKYFLTELLLENEQYYCFIDKNRTYFHAFMKREFANVRVIPCIHALHTKSYKDIQASDMNLNYKDIFSNLSIVDGMILLTEKQREDIVSRFGEHKCYYVIPHAFEQLPDRVEWQERQPNKVVALGRYSSEKQFNLMIEMFAEVVKQEPQAILEIYGYGSERGKLLKLIQKLEMIDNIFLKDYVENVSDIYESASLSLLTSQSEGFSLVTMESLAHGCPVISFDIKYGPSDMIKDGENGFLVEPDCKDVYVEKIIKFLQTPELRKKMSKNAYHMIEPFQANHVAKKWEKLIDDLAFEK